MRLFSSVFVLCLFGMGSAFSAPSVRMLGTNTARVGTNAAVVKSETSGASSQSQQRLGSIRAKNLSGGVPVTTNKGTLTSSSGEGSRISLSNASLNKYLHSPTSNAANSITKPNAAPVKPDTSDVDLTDLMDRVQDLEDGMDDKQDNISVGPGLTFENNEINLNNYYTQLPNRIEQIENNIDSKVTMSEVNNVLTNNYYNQQEVQTLINNHMGTDVKTIYDYQTGDRAWVTVVDTFDPGIFED